jgi:hypothetical protein
MLTPPSACRRSSPIQASVWDNDIRRQDSGTGRILIARAAIRLSVAFRGRWMATCWALHR